MSGPVHWVIELNINDGELENFKGLMEEMVAATQADEPGAVIYEWFISDDQKTCRVYERYADSDAARAHMKNFGETFADRFMGMVKIGRTDLYGDPDDHIMKLMGKMGAVRYSQIGGFAR